MNACLTPARLSIWDPVHLALDETGRDVHVTLAERNMLIGGEPGSGKRVELGLWRRCAHRFIGPSMDEAIDTLKWLQAQIDERTDWLLDHKKRKITPDMGFPVYLTIIDEVAYFSATVGTPGQQKEFSALNRDVVARGRAPGIIAIEATQRPSTAPEL